MSRAATGAGAAVWVGEEPARHEAFGGGELWIGRHAGDRDVLVFDPAEADPHAEVLAFYSLGQHRMRSFPRAAVERHIEPVTDELGRAQAQRDFAQRDARRAEHEQALNDAREQRLERQREGVVAAHRRHVEALGLPYAGVVDSADAPRGRRRTKCHSCGVALDDFTGKACAGCGIVLCSCGACACRPE